MNVLSEFKQDYSRDAHSQAGKVTKIYTEMRFRYGVQFDRLHVHNMSST
jgi:hypothetical protein